MIAPTAEDVARAWIESRERRKSTTESDGGDVVSSLEFDLPREEPEACWAVILEILSRIPADPTNQLFQVLAAGMMEDLLAEHGHTFIDRVEEQARRNPSFNLLLGGVWQNAMADDIWSRVQKCRNKVW